MSSSGTISLEDGHLEQIEVRPALIEQVHARLLSAIIDGTLVPGRRLTQDSIAAMLGVSRQPVSHALQVLRRQGLLVDAGKRGIAVAPIDGSRVIALYQVREALDGLAAELAARRCSLEMTEGADLVAARAALEAGETLDGRASMPALVNADVEFHSAIHRLSGNAAISETIADQWPHFRRTMALVLESPSMSRRVWREHRNIFDAIVAGDAAAAGHLARQHTRVAGEETAARFELAVHAV